MVGDHCGMRQIRTAAPADYEAIASVSERLSRRGMSAAICPEGPMLGGSDVLPVPLQEHHRPGSDIQGSAEEPTASARPPSTSTTSPGRDSLWAAKCSANSGPDVVPRLIERAVTYVMEHYLGARVSERVHVHVTARCGSIVAIAALREELGQARRSVPQVHGQAGSGRVAGQRASWPGTAHQGRLQRGPRAAARQDRAPAVATADSDRGLEWPRSQLVRYSPRTYR